MIYISDNDLNFEQFIVNAQFILNYLCVKYGWTKNAVCGILGNLKRESMANPGLWEHPSTKTGGYGLVQWTPSTLYSEWAEQNGYEVRNMESQLKRIKWELDNHEQYYAIDYHMTFTQFVSSYQSPDSLAEIFCHNYERPSVLAMEERKEAALYCFNNLEVQNNFGSGIIAEGPYRKPLKSWLLMRAKRIQVRIQR